MHNHLKRYYFLFFFTFATILASASPLTFQIKGRITTGNGVTPIPYANIIVNQQTIGTQSNEAGEYELSGLEPGFYKIRVSALGYKPYLSYEIRLSTRDIELNVRLEEENMQLKEVNVTAPRMRRNPDAPLALQVISLKEIEKIPGANRDISKVISSFAGVATPTVYRNDILVRGGGPSENRFYLDGVEIPNINHFATQGASGGPVGILNADLLREVDFYSGAFPASRENGVSSILDFKLKDGSSEKRSYKFTLGASEAGISSNGSLSEKTTYQLSARYSYLQLLFSLLDMSFLPRYVDAQFKIRTRFNASHELTVLGIGAYDDMQLNDDVDPTDESKYQLYQTLPVYRQKTYTLGAVYKHYAGNHVQTLVLSNSLLWNSAKKFRDNQTDQPDMLRYDYRSDEGQTRLRFEHVTRTGGFRLSGGAGIEYAVYRNKTLNRRFEEEKPELIRYDSRLGIWKGSLFTSASYESPEGRITGQLGLRTDINSYSSHMANPLKQLSPRGSFSWQMYGPLYLNLTGGRYFQLPAYTSMGFENNEGIRVNEETLRYMRCDQTGGGFEYRSDNAFKLNLDGFYKWYNRGALSVKDSIPVACLGNTYGVIGDEAVTSTAKGRAYGIETSLRWNPNPKSTVLASYTFVRSMYYDPYSKRDIPSSWDNRNLFTGTFLYALPRNWEIGVKLRLMGGSPYTPYDTEASALVESWDLIHEPVYDYSKFNSLRLKTFTQVDLRIDKTFYWKGVMLGFYIDIQNLLNAKYQMPSLYISTGVVENPDAPREQQRYIMKWIKEESGTLLPTLGFTLEI